MAQSQIAGIVLIVMGIVIALACKFIWKIGESWKSNRSEGPSKVFVLICRILGAVFAVVGILLSLNIVK